MQPDCLRLFRLSLELYHAEPHHWLLTSGGFSFELLCTEINRIFSFAPDLVEEFKRFLPNNGCVYTVLESRPWVCQYVNCFEKFDMEESATSHFKGHDIPPSPDIHLAPPAPSSAGQYYASKNLTYGISIADNSYRAMSVSARHVTRHFI